jgi:hypothetical protein
MPVAACYQRMINWLLAQAKNDGVYEREKSIAKQTYTVAQTCANDDGAESVDDKSFGMRNEGGSFT